MEFIMSPRKSYGDKPMTSAERVKRTRWANRVEDTADKLLRLLESAPEPLHRTPIIPSDLLERLSALPVTLSSNEDSEENKWVLQPGTGHQAANKKKALQFITNFFDATPIDNGTVQTEDWGLCYVAAYTHQKGAMISAPNRGTGKYGSRDWHKRDHIIMFRDLGNGHCKIYVSKIAPLFEHRTIGRGGVTWEDVEKLCESEITCSAEEVIKELG